MTKQKKAVILITVLLSVLCLILFGLWYKGRRAKNADTELPKEAKDAFLAYLRSDSYEAMFDSILPAAAAEEAKSGKAVIGDYSFGFLSASYEDEQILECSRLPKDQAQRIGAFWSAGFSMQGITANFTAEDGYDVTASAVCVIKDDEFGETEEQRLKITRRLTLLKIKNDRWIVIPSSDSDTNSYEPIG